MKHKFLAALGALAPFGALAAPTNDYSSVVNSLQTEATGVIDAVTPAVQAIVVALFIFVAIGLVWKLIKRFVNKG